MPQVIINCNAGGTCGGGDPHGVYEYLSEQGLPDETCQAYVAADGACQPMGVCETCEPGVGCAAVSEYDRYGVSEYGDVTGSFLDSVSNADAMKAELYARGPIACDISVTAKFEAYTGGIFSQQRLFSLPNHIIAVVGYGVTDNGTEYWIARNSWGTAWGEQGFARILIHRDNLGIERGCTFGVPDVSVVKPKVAFDAPVPVAPKLKVMQGGACLKRRPGPRTSLLRTPQPHTYLKASDIPASYDIRNVSGISFATPTRNQHIPVCAPPAFVCAWFDLLAFLTLAFVGADCGSCWAHSTASSLSDRFALARGRAFPEIYLSPQVLVDCVKENSHGCEGGDPNAAFEYIMQQGITDESCSPYQAADKTCSALSLCGDCSPNPMRGCYPVTPSTLFRVSEHGQAYGEEQMIAEIAARGPIVCGMCVTEAFERYAGGTFHDDSGCKTEMHAISIAGYGTDAQGRKTWLGRNSWGTPWGEDGWFTLERGVDTLGIESIGCDVRTLVKDIAAVACMRLTRALPIMLLAVWSCRASGLDAAVLDEP